LHTNSSSVVPFDVNLMAALILKLQVNENNEFIERKREVVSFSPNDKASVDSFLQEEKSSGNAPFTRFYASIAENHQPRGRKTL